MRIRHCLDYVVVNFLLRFLNVCNLIVIKIHSSIYKYIVLCLKYQVKHAIQVNCQHKSAIKILNN